MGKNKKKVMYDGIEARTFFEPGKNPADVNVNNKENYHQNFINLLKEKEERFRFNTQIAAHLGIHAATLGTLIQEGKLPLPQDNNIVYNNYISAGNEVFRDIPREKWIPTITETLKLPDEFINTIKDNIIDYKYTSEHITKAVFAFIVENSVTYENHDKVKHWVNDIKKQLNSAKNTPKTGANLEIHFFETITRLVTHSNEAEKATDYHKLIAEYLKQGLYKLAEEIINFALEHFEFNSELLLDKIKICSLQGKLDDAYTAIINTAPCYWSSDLLMCFIDQFCNQLKNCLNQDEIKETLEKAIECVSTFEEKLKPSTDKNKRTFECILLAKPKLYIAAGKRDEAKKILSGIPETETPIPECRKMYLEEFLANTKDYQKIFDIAKKGLKELPETTLQSSRDRELKGYFAYRAALALEAIKKDEENALRLYQLAHYHTTDKIVRYNLKNQFESLKSIIPAWEEKAIDNFDETDEQALIDFFKLYS